MRAHAKHIGCMGCEPRDVWSLRPRPTRQRRPRCPRPRLDRHHRPCRPDRRTGHAPQPPNQRSPSSRARGHEWFCGGVGVAPCALSAAARFECLYGPRHPVHTKRCAELDGVARISEAMHLPIPSKALQRYRLNDGFGALRSKKVLQLHSRAEVCFSLDLYQVCLWILPLCEQGSFRFFWAQIAPFGILDCAF